MRVRGSQQQANTPDHIQIAVRPRWPTDHPAATEHEQVIRRPDPLWERTGVSYGRCDPRERTRYGVFTHVCPGSTAGPPYYRPERGSTIRRGEAAGALSWGHTLQSSSPSRIRRVRSRPTVMAPHQDVVAKCPGSAGSHVDCRPISASGPPNHGTRSSRSNPRGSTGEFPTPPPS